MSNLMKCVLYPSKGSNLEFRMVEIPEPKDGQVRIRVMACGVCHTDLMMKTTSTSYPRIPGHEVAGVIDKLGSGVVNYKVGDRVGVGFFGGCCHWCQQCKQDNWIGCASRQLCGLHYDGGYAEYCCVPFDALSKLPDGMTFEQAAPMLCAGITVYNGIVKQNIKPGSLVCVQGIGGLGHLAIQFARRLGYEVVAYSSGADKESLARELGAHHYLDGSKSDSLAKLTAMAPMMIILTGPSKSAVESLIPTLAFGGRMLLLAALSEGINVNGTMIVMKNISIHGWLAGDSRDSEATMKFAQITQVQPMIETFPIEKALEAVEKMETGKVRFRSVLVMSENRL